MELIKENIDEITKLLDDDYETNFLGSSKQFLLGLQRCARFKNANKYNESVLWELSELQSEVEEDYSTYMEVCEKVLAAIEETYPFLN